MTSTTVWMLSSGTSSSAHPPSTVPPAGPVSRASAIFMTRPCRVGTAHRLFRWAVPTPRNWPLAPRDGHGRRLAVAVLAHVLRPVLVPRHEPHELLHPLLVGLPALLGG